MSHRQHVEGIQLQEHRPAVVDVPFTRGKRVSLAFSFPFSDAHRYVLSYRRMSQEQRYGSKERKQGMRRRRRILQVAHGLPKPMLPINPVELLRPSQLHNLQLHSLPQPLLLPPHLPCWRARAQLEAGPASGSISAVCRANIPMIMNNILFKRVLLSFSSYIVVASLTPATTFFFESLLFYLRESITYKVSYLVQNAD